MLQLQKTLRRKGGAMEDLTKKQMRIISTGELERRWNATRAMMRERGIDYLVMQNSEEFLGGTVRWFTDLTARHQFPMTVIFPVDDEMTVINVGSDPPAEQTFPPAWASRGIKKRLGGVYFPSINYTSSIDGELAAGVLKEKSKPVVGLVERSFIPLTFYESLTKNLPDATFVDATEWVDEIRAIKSQEEIALIRETAAIQDAAMGYLRSVIRPGLKDFEVYSEAHAFCSRHGSQRGLVLVGSGPIGTIVGPEVYHFQNRMIKEGDVVVVLIEVNGPGGYYTETARMFLAGKEPPQELQDAFGVTVEAMETVARQLVPGAVPGELWQWYKDFMTTRGYFPIGRNFSHGQGLSLVERPTLRPDEPWKLRAGMNLAVHPPAVRPGCAALVCDNYLITENGPEDLHRFPKEIVVV
jgi:Xaa-Pro aminopeptidase